MEVVRDNAIVEIHSQIFTGLDVKRVVLQQAIDVPNGGGSAQSLYSKRSAGTGRSAISDVKMKYSEGVLACEFKGAAFLIPIANIAVMYL